MKSLTANVADKTYASLRLKAFMDGKSLREFAGEILDMSALLKKRTKLNKERTAK